MNIDKLVHFELGSFHSDKKNKDFYVIYLCVGETKVVVNFITQNQYNDLKSKLS